MAVLLALQQACPSLQHGLLLKSMCHDTEQKQFCKCLDTRASFLLLDADWLSSNSHLRCLPRVEGEEEEVGSVILWLPFFRYNFLFKFLAAIQLNSADILEAKRLHLCSMASRAMINPKRTTSSVS